MIAKYAKYNWQILTDSLQDKCCSAQAPRKVGILSRALSRTFTTSQEKKEEKARHNEIEELKDLNEREAAVEIRNQDALNDLI